MMFKMINNRAEIDPGHPVLYIGTSINGITSGGIYFIRIYSERGSPKVWVYELQHKKCEAILPYNEQDWII